MHFTGMNALIVGGHLEWDSSLAVIAVVLGVLLGTAATAAFRRLDGKAAIAAGAVMLTLAICAKVGGEHDWPGDKSLSVAIGRKGLLR